MKELCIPIPHFTDDQIAEVEVNIQGQKTKYFFRVESFPWLAEKEDLEQNPNNSIPARQLESFIKINKLKKAIQDYDPEWELIQIFTPVENSKHIQLLYRKRNK